MSAAEEHSPATVTPLVPSPASSRQKMSQPSNRLANAAGPDEISRPRPAVAGTPLEGSVPETAAGDLATDDTAADLISQEATHKSEKEYEVQDHGLRRIIRNFTPSWFIITMSTGVTSILLHQLPYNGHWLRIIANVFFVLNVVLFLLFTVISVVRYTLFPDLIVKVLQHPHQSLFVATFPVGLGTIINMVVLVCVPAWGEGWAVFAWVLWWIDSVMALMTCFHLIYIIMSHRRSELVEMTALYFIPIVAIVIAAASGNLVATVLTNQSHQLWTLFISYVFWGIGAPLSWIILTLYFLRMMTQLPLQREVIVSLLLPIGPLGLSGFAIISLGKLAKRIFITNDALPHVQSAPGDIVYVAGFLVGFILWSFAIIWFVLAVIMMIVSGGFPFNMGWWGFIFPVGVFTLLTIVLGEEMESHFLKILSCVLTGICVAMWIVVAVGTIQRSLKDTMFFAPCLGTDLFLKRLKSRSTSDTEKGK